MRKNIIIINVLAVIFGILASTYGISFAIKGETLLGASLITICNFTISIVCAFDWFMGNNGQI